MVYLRRVLYGTVLATVAAGCSDASPASIHHREDAPQLTLNGDRVQRRAPLHKELDRKLVIGRRVDDGYCVFEQMVRHDTGETERLEAVVEFDPETCRYVVAKLDLTNFVRPQLPPPPEKLGPAAPQPSSSGMSTSSSTRSAQYTGGGAGLSSAPSGSAGAQSYQVCTPHVGMFGQALQFISTMDPILIQTSGSEQVVLYNYADGCVNYVHSTLVSRWQPLSGWGLQSHVHYTPQPKYPDWRAVRAKGRQTMRNTVFADTFCPLSPGNTYTYYTNTIDLWYDGYPAFFRTVYSTGGCSGLLWSSFYTAFS